MSLQFAFLMLRSSLSSIAIIKHSHSFHFHAVIQTMKNSNSAKPNEKAQDANPGDDSSKSSSFVDQLRYTSSQDTLSNSSKDEIPHPSPLERLNDHRKYLISPILESLLTLRSDPDAPKEWTTRYRLAVRILRKVMSKISEFDQPNPKYFQTLTEMANPLPFTAVLKTDSNFTVYQRVVDFMKGHTKEAWPSVADEKAEIYGEWVDACKGKVNQTRVVYQIHGGTLSLIH